MCNAGMAWTWLAPLQHGSSAQCLAWIGMIDTIPVAAG